MHGRQQAGQSTFMYIEEQLSLVHGRVTNRDIS